MPQCDFISNEVRANSLIISDIEECSSANDDDNVHIKEWDIEGEKVCISIKK